MKLTIASLLMTVGSASAFLIVPKHSVTSAAASSSFCSIHGAVTTKPRFSASFSGSSRSSALWMADDDDEEDEDEEEDEDVEEQAKGGDEKNKAGGSKNQDEPDEEGSQLAASFFREARIRNIQLSSEDLEDAENDDFDDEDDEDEDDAARVLRKYSDGETSTSPAEGAKDDNYKVPAKIPDSQLSASEVVKVVMSALNHNDIPTPNKGVEILFAYSSENSRIKSMEGLTVEEYASYLLDTEYKILFRNNGVRVDSADYSEDGNKAYVTARVQTLIREVVPVNFILGVDGNGVWMVDSMLIRPSTMRRRNRYKRR